MYENEAFQLFASCLREMTIIIMVVLLLSFMTIICLIARYTRNFSFVEWSGC